MKTYYPWKLAIFGDPRNFIPTKIPYLTVVICEDNVKKKACEQEVL